MTIKWCVEEWEEIISEEMAKDCQSYNHETTTFLTKEEIKKAEQKSKKSTKFQYTTIPKKDVVVTQTIQDFKIVPLRPIFYNLETTKRMILVYLPTKVETETGNEENLVKKTEFENKAYFVVQNRKATVRKRREILPIDDSYFKDKFKINILPIWEDVRWQISDLKKWITETKFTEPKLIYELLDKTCRKFLEFASEQEYIKFNLWNIGTYFYELFDCYPYNDFTGLKGSGKSKCISFQKLVCFNAVMSADITSSATFRLIQGLGCTLLLDETEQFKNQRNDKAQEVRTLLLQGFLKNQWAIRNESTKDKSFIPTQFNIFSPKSLAHINGLDDVLEDRCIANINKRALNQDVKNSWANEQDKDTEQIRNLCYRLFLDYSEEILSLKEEAENLLPVHGRERMLWTPIMTLAVFFEKHGIENLVSKINECVKVSSKQKQAYDEIENRDFRILDYLDKLAVNFAQDKERIKNNPLGWLPHMECYNELIMRKDQFDINPDFFTKKTLSETFTRLGIIKEKKEGGYSFLITRSVIDDIKKRYDLGQESKKTSSDITSFSSEGSEIKNQEGILTSKTELTELTEPNEPKIDIHGIESKTELTELTDNKKSSESSGEKTT